MKIFAMIDGQQTGPMELDDIVAAGVRPDTYVWTKGMSDWQKAAEVPDICRYFRLRLAGVLPDVRGNGASEQQRMLDEQAEQAELLRQFPPLIRNQIIRSGMKISRDNLPQHPGRPESRWLPVIIYLVCTILILIGFFLLQM